MLAGHEASGYIPIDRSKSPQGFESIEFAAQRIQERNLRVIFPEGTRSLEGLTRIQEGGFMLALQSTIPLCRSASEVPFRSFPNVVVENPSRRVDMTVGTAIPRRD